MARLELRWCAGMRGSGGEKVAALDGFVRRICGLPQACFGGWGGIPAIRISPYDVAFFNFRLGRGCPYGPAAFLLGVYEAPSRLTPVAA